MSTFDTKPPRSLVTGSGVTVLVHEAPEPEPEPEPEPAYPRAIIIPERQSAEDREALARSLYAEHGDLLRATLMKREGVSAESAKDLAQRVILLVCDKMQKERIDNVRAYLLAVAHYEARNHLQRWTPDLDRGADAEAVMASAPSPETDARHAELRAKLHRYIERLPAGEAEVIVAVDIDGLTVDEAAEKLGRPRGTVATTLTRARLKLKEMARASER